MKSEYTLEKRTEGYNAGEWVLTFPIELHPNYEIISPSEIGVIREMVKRGVFNAGKVRAFDVPNKNADIMAYVYYPSMPDEKEVSDDMKAIGDGLALDIMEKVRLIRDVHAIVSIMFPDKVSVGEGKAS